MDKLEKDKREIREMVSEMAMAVKVSFAVLQLETPELAEAYLQAWREQLDELQGKLPAKPVAGQIQQRKAMLSQPMGGKTDEEIVNVQERAIAELHALGFVVESTLFTDEWYRKNAPEHDAVIQRPLFFLAKSLEKMSLCHTAYFCKGWENARGCRIEHEAAKAYGLEIIYENQ